MEYRVSTLNVGDITNPIFIIMKRRHQMENESKDMFWYYIAGLIGAVIMVLVVVKGSEHDKYATAAAAIKEDSANSSSKR